MMQGHRTSLCALIAGVIPLSSCSWSNSSSPNIGVYRFETGAASVIKSHFSRVGLKFETAAEHVLDLVDNGDKIINEYEAHSAILAMHAAEEGFYTNIMSLTPEQIPTTQSYKGTTQPASSPSK